MEITFSIPSLVGNIYRHPVAVNGKRVTVVIPPTGAIQYEGDALTDAEKAEIEDVLIRD